MIIGAICSIPGLPKASFDLSSEYQDKFLAIVYRSHATLTPAVELAWDQDDYESKMEAIANTIGRDRILCAIAGVWTEGPSLGWLAEGQQISWPGAGEDDNANGYRDRVLSAVCGAVQTALWSGREIK